MTPPEIVVAGGGIAALELVLALRALAGELVHVTVVAPERDFVARPLLVAEPLAGAIAHRRPLRAIAADLGFDLVSAAVAAVEPERGRVALHSGATLRYDTLVLAPGAKRLPAFDEAIHIGDKDGTRALQDLHDAVAAGTVRSVAFVAPTTTGWLLPLYEAALLTAAIGERARISLVTPEERPLAVFGDASSAVVGRALADAGIEFSGGRSVRRDMIDADRIVSLPLVRGPRIPGVPATGLYGLIPADRYGRVPGVAGVYAIGDATDFPVKQGGIACLQADAAAAHIAARHGADVTPRPFEPVLRASLLTGRGEPIALGAGEVEKLPGRHLAPYLTAKTVSQM